MNRDLYYARAELLGARERLAMFRRLGQLNNNDRDLYRDAIAAFYDALDSVWKAQGNR